MGDKLLQFSQLIGRSCDHKFVHVGIKETMSVMSNTVGIQLASYTVGNWKCHLLVMQLLSHCGGTTNLCSPIS